MRSLVYLLMSLLLLGATACKDNLRKEVEEKWDDGNPKTVKFYNQDKEVVKEISYYPDGAVKMEGRLQNNERTGEWKAYYRDGTVWSKARYKEGRQHGPYVTYYPDGNIRFRGYMTSGNRTGEWIFYDKQGNIAKKINYDER